MSEGAHRPECEFVMLGLKNEENGGQELKNFVRRRKIVPLSGLFPEQYDVSKNPQIPQKGDHDPVDSQPEKMTSENNGPKSDNSVFIMQGEE